MNTHIIDLCEQLLIHGERVVLVTDENQCDYDMAIDHLKENEKFVYFSISMLRIQSDIRKILYVANQFCDVIKRYHIDLVHTHSQSLCVVVEIVKLRMKVPYIWINHIDAIATPKLFEIILQIFHFPIISVSTDLKKMLERNYKVPEDRITVANNGINIGKFESLSVNEKEILKKKWECKGNFVIGILARMVPIKGHRYLLKAIDLIQKNIKFLISNFWSQEKCMMKLIYKNFCSIAKKMI